jgi:hypothetical protein
MLIAFFYLCRKRQAEVAVDKEGNSVDLLFTKGEAN